MEYCAPVKNKHHMYIYWNEQAILLNEKGSYRISIVWSHLKYIYIYIHVCIRVGKDIC